MKKVIETIKKIAEGIDDPPPPPKYRANRNISEKIVSKNISVPERAGRTENIPEKSKSIAPTKPSISSNQMGSSIPAVKEMQKAILNIANIISSTDVTSMSGNQDAQMKGPQSRSLGKEVPGGPAVFPGTEQDKEYLGGSDPFGNFIVQNFFPPNTSSKQFVNVDVKGGTERTEQSIAPTNLRGIIDTIKRIGTPGTAATEKSVDGIWKERTNNALHLIKDLVIAMYKFTAAMHIPVQGLEKFGAYVKAIPEKYTDMKSQDEITAKANEITPLLNNLSVFFTNFKSQILENKKLRESIDQKKPFASYNKRQFKNDDIAQLSLLELPGIKFDWIQNPTQNYITLKELSGIDEFKKFIERAGMSPTPETMIEILKRLENSLNKDPNRFNPGY